MGGRKTASLLVLVVLGLVVTVIVAITIGWAVIQVGLGQAAAYGAGILSALITALALLGFGGRSNDTTVNTDVTFDPQDIEVKIQQENLQKETNPVRADFPGRAAAILRKLRDWGISYSAIQTVMKVGIVIGVLIMIPFATALFIYSLGLFGMNIPPELIAYGEQIVSTLGLYSTLIGVAAGVLPVAGALIGLTSVNQVHDKTTCDGCPENFCLTFDYALYHPDSHEEHSTTEYDDENNPVGTRTIGYSYKGTLYATCTERDEMVEIEDWNWYVPTR
jgi:hypothetical protein